jgi:sulfide:quinone oxidoreductase
VVAVNALRQLDDKVLTAGYDGYGSCSLMVGRGKIVLAEFDYVGKLAPSFPTWLVHGTKNGRLFWMLKVGSLAWLHRNGMLKGRDWLAGPGGLIAQ